MSHRPLVYVRDAGAIKLRANVNDVIPRLVEKSQRWTGSRNCPQCGDTKTPRATRCMACHQKNKKLLELAGNNPMPSSGLNKGSSRWRGAKVGKTPDQPPIPQMVKQPDGTWRSKPWEPPGSAPSAASPAAESPPLDSTRPTVRLVASHPPARASGASFTRRSTMTTDPYTYRAANAVPNGEPDITTMTVDQIVKSRGVGKRYAYSLLRRAQEEKMGNVPVPQNQRELILTVLHRSGDYIRNTDQLSEAVHRAGSKLPPHDVTKTLWSLQKSQYVRFRERANGMLYAIKLTPDGKKIAALIVPLVLVTPVVEEPPVTTWAATIEEPIPPTVYEEISEGQPTEPSFVVATYPSVPWIAGNMGGWPSMRDVRDRHNKAVKIKAALALLEEVGEDDAVLTLLDKITFTPLEDEVVQLLRFLKEIE